MSPGRSRSTFRDCQQCHRIHSDRIGGGGLFPGGQSRVRIRAEILAADRCGVWAVRGGPSPGDLLRQRAARVAAGVVAKRCALSVSRRSDGDRAVSSRRQRRLTSLSLATLAGFSADWNRLFFRVPLLSVLADENGAAGRALKLTLSVGFYLAQFHRSVDVGAEGGIHAVEAGEVAFRAHGHFSGAVRNL